MKNRKMIVIAVSMFACLFSESATAQSFWLHKQLNTAIGDLYQIIANDSSDCMLSSGSPDFEALTLDFGNSWKYVIADSPSYPMRFQTTFAGFVHPAHNLIIVGYNDFLGPVGHIVRSTDAGITWTDSAIGLPLKQGGPINNIEAIAALDSSHIFVLIKGDSSLVSSDAGATWTWIPCPYFSYASPFNDWLIRAAYPAPNTLLFAARTNIAVWPNSSIFRTTNLGETWDSSFEPNSMITKFDFVNARLGFASGIIFNDISSGGSAETAMLYKTIDGGGTWKTLLDTQIVPISTSSFNNTAGFYSVAFADSLHGFASGDEGLIMQTSDGGTVWNEMHSDFTSDAQSMDLLYDVAYPDTNHAMIGSSDGSILIYKPNGILSLPNITYPKFSPPSAPQTFDVTWDPVPNATRYWIKITGGVNHVNDTVVVDDSNVTADYYHLSNLLDTSPTAKGVQYDISVQAFNATNESNVAHRTFIVYHSSDAVKGKLHISLPLLIVYPNPATNEIRMAGGTRSVVEILDALGRAQACPMQDGKFDVSNLPAGVYYVESDGARARFVKE